MQDYKVKDKSFNQTKQLVALSILFQPLKMTTPEHLEETTFLFFHLTESIRHVLYS